MFESRLYPQPSKVPMLRTFWNWLKCLFKGKPRRDSKAIERMLKELSIDPTLNIRIGSAGMPGNGTRERYTLVSGYRRMTAAKALMHNGEDYIDWHDEPGSN